MADTLRPLPVLTPNAEAPSGRAYEALRRAKIESGYPGLVQPRQAVQGSPEPILAVGCKPGWLTRYVLVDSFEDHDALVHAMQAILIWDDGSVSEEADLLSEWMGCEVKLIGVESNGPSFS